jgi:hypothetical protein
MSLVFTRARAVTRGTQIKSDDLKYLGLAHNDRLGNTGIGDGAERVMFGIQRLFNQVRRGSDDGLRSPPSQEFHEYYIHAKPGQISWPTVGSEEEGGPNVACPSMGYKFGIEGTPGVFPEEDRLSKYDAETSGPGVPAYLVGGDIPQTLGEKWELGKDQRGGIVPGVGASAPLLDAGTSYWPVFQGTSIFHHREFGGFYPSPELTGYCNNATDETPPSPNYKIFFTGVNSNAGNVKEYAGTCPEEPLHVKHWPVAQTPRAYYVVLNNGTVETLDKKLWREGPYRFGGIFRKLDGGQLPRMLGEYSAELRGSMGQRSDPSYPENVKKVAFDVQRFLASQYIGAPNIAHSVGPDALEADYPRFSVDGSASLTQAAGTVLGSHGYAGGFVFGGYYARGTKLAGAVTIAFYNGPRLLHEFSLKPDDTGLGEALFYFDQAETPLPLNVVIRSGLEFTASDGELAVECSEQLAYKPEMDDYSVINRLMTATVDGSGSGKDVDGKQVENDWFSNGCIITEAIMGNDPIAVNQNAVFEAGRNFAQKHTRIWNRSLLVGYEVIGGGVGDGQSVLYFKRYALGLENDTPLDAFDGIAPPRGDVGSGNVRAGVRYVVRNDLGGGSVTYNGNVYSPGAVITGVPDRAEYDRAGGAELWEYEGIILAARPGASPSRGGFTNEWVIWQKNQMYSHLETSPYKLNGLVVDQYAFTERCHNFSDWYGADRNPSLWDQMLYRQDPPAVLNAEATTGYRYAGDNVNHAVADDPDDPMDAANQFYRSCFIYERPLRTVSCTSFLEAGEEIVRIVLDGRFQHGSGAPGVIARGNYPVTSPEERTTENAFLEYLRLIFEGQDCERRVGDMAWHGRLDLFYPQVKGSCIPHIFGLHLIPLPVDDGNNIPQATDSPMLSEILRQCCWYQTYMCGGWVDVETTTALCDESSNLMDFTLEELCRQGFGGRWFSVLPGYGILDGKLVTLRPDYPEGFGAMPGTNQWAEIFNQVVSTINLMTKARVMIPWGFYSCASSGEKVTELGADWPEGVECGATNHAVFKGNITFEGPDVPECVQEECVLTLLEPCVMRARSTVNPDASLDLRTGLPCGSTDVTQFLKSSFQMKTFYRFVPIDGPAMQALPADVRQLLEGGSFGFVGFQIKSTRKTHAIEVGTLEEAAICVTEADYENGARNPFWVDPVGYRFELEETHESKCVSFGASGELVAEVPPGGDGMACRWRTSSTGSGWHVDSLGSGSDVEVHVLKSMTPYCVVPVA